MKIFKTMSFLFFLVSALACTKETDDIIINPPPPEPIDTLETEIFTFLSNGTATNGKIYIPDSYDTIKNLPTIYLIDFKEQHFKIAKDEFEKVVAGAKKIEGFDALIITLEEHLGLDAHPEDFQKYYDLYYNMTSYVDSNYSNNASKTFIGRGSEAGIVMTALFLEETESSVFENFIVTDPSTSFTDYIIDKIENDDFPQEKLNKKLHFSFSSSNNRGKCNKFIQLLNDAQYPWLEFEAMEYGDNDYENTYPTSFADGLYFVFNN